jgi:2-polyprenyl-3-methyl-5-hydroxy-6-metoxy-1,4-benzoquinol methylase
VYPDSDRSDVAHLLPPTVKKVLDVGCCFGGFGALLESRGIETWGIEPDPTYAATAEGRMTKVIRGFFPGAAPSDEKFDCVTFNDVLEHMVDPAEALATTRDLLDPGGWVLASIPNIRHITVLFNLIVKGRWDYTDTGILDRTHLRFFTKATMRELFEATGFRVESITPLATTRLTTPKLRAMRVLGHRKEQFLVVQYGLLAQRP